MSNLSSEAQTLRDRISRYFEPTREELDRILKLEFQFVQLLDLILRFYSLDSQTQKAITCLEESRNWAGLSVKRGQQIGYEPLYSSPPSEISPRDTASMESAFAVVSNAILNRCVSNRERDCALARLDDARIALRLDVSSSS